MLTAQLLVVKLQNSVSYKSELESQLLQAQVSLQDLEIAQGVTHDDDFWARFPSIQRVLQQHGNNPAEVSRLIKIITQQIKQLKASIELWELLESLIERFQDNNGNGGGGAGAGGAAAAAGESGIIA